MAIGQNIPLFFRLYHKLKQDIVRGEIPKGSKIDTIEELARQHGMSQTSVRKSLDLLEAEGLLIKKQGWGTTVPENLNLRFFDLATLISSRETIPEVKTADIEIISTQWIESNNRLSNLLELNGASAKQKIFKVNCLVTFTKQLQFKAHFTFHFPLKWLRKVKYKDAMPPRDIIVKATEWMESTPIKMRESLLPFLCTDELADQLDLPDGTPVFYHTVVLTDIKQKTGVCWEMISTANIFYREIDLD
ncbi:MAG: hypothetical protein VR64_12215 [Desulfatitalea sp. BRH_c12]|nr:MAG: hypothetical protein VR64_12215 [Desulfatitalea sp. BRH_c12]